MPRYRRKVLILLHHVMNRMYLLHIHLSVYQKMTPSPHYPSNCLSETYLVVFRIAANMPDMHVLCDFIPLSLVLSREHLDLRYLAQLDASHLFSSLSPGAVGVWLTTPLLASAWPPAFVSS